MLFPQFTKSVFSCFWQNTHSANIIITVITNWIATTFLCKTISLVQVGLL